ARATVEGAAAAIGNHPAVRALGSTCGGRAARAERLLACLDAYPAAAAGVIGPTRLALRYAGSRPCDTPPDDDERGGEHRHEEQDRAGPGSFHAGLLCWGSPPGGTLREPAD